ncbi:tyrosine-type recombinase/integrase [Haloferax sp. DFSO52]|uniref:tyrosine-type recombinase/integrase n=1 Tax=Haloferax sp. DFSO52 TaxID=3388505 RepID=UPI003A837535
MSDQLDPMTTREAVELYLEDRKPEVSESTIQAHGYRLSHFIRWCEGEGGIENLNDLTGRDLMQYKNWRRDDGGLNNVTMHTQLSTLRVFIKWCERVDAVERGLHDKITLPSLSRNEDRREVMLTAEAAHALLAFLRQFEFATRTHALIEVLWHTGMRIGAAHGLDLEDYDRDEQCLQLHHRPETDTRLKNKEAGERFASMSAEVCDVLDAYIEVNRYDRTDDYGREPLFTSKHGRPAKTTLRDSIYGATRPCTYAQGCPHDRDPETCEAMDRNRASKCPSSVSPHAIRRGSITHHLSKDVPEKVVSDRMNVSLDILEKHYDRRGEREKAEQRRGYLDNL